VTKRRRRLLVGLAVLAFLGVLALPGVHWRLVGWAKGEPFYQGRPVSYWRQRLSGGNIWVFYPYSHPWEKPDFCLFYSPRDDYFTKAIQLLERLTGRDRDNEIFNPSPMFHGDPEALTVLLTLLGDGRPKVRAMAAQELGQLGERGRPAATALRNLLSDRGDLGLDATVGRTAAIALRRIDPDALKKANDCP
jgi:hypothetical protein